jgi:hypothetical protein
MLNFFIKSVLIFIFIFIFIPVGIFIKIFNVDYLGLKTIDDKNSYWIKR